MIRNVKILFRLLRVHQWPKNVLCFAGIFFAQKLLDPASLRAAIECFFAFAAASSGVYILNDLVDAERDRLHPKKSKRPIASGDVSRPAAIGIMVALFAGALTLAAALHTWVLALIAVYVAQNLAYSFGVKKVPILDVFFVASGFVWRALAGVIAVAAPASSWLILCTFLLSLLISFSKRKCELLSLEGDAAHHREALSGYNLHHLDIFLSITASSVVMAYALYCLDQRTVDKFGHDLLVTFPFVVFGILRFLLVSAKGAESDPIVVFARDRTLLVNSALWAGALVVLLYAH